MPVIESSVPDGDELTGLLAPTPQLMRVIIVTDVCLFREGLRGVLARSDLKVIASISPSEARTEFLEALRPDVILVDAATVRASEMVVHVTDVLPGTPVVAFAVAECDEEEVLACAEAGVAGFVERSATIDDLVTVLHSAARGEMSCSPRVAAVVFRQMARLSAYREVALHNPGLTPREEEVVWLIEHGLSNKEIAQRLGIEVATVKNHVHNLLEKLHVRRRGDVAAVARPKGRWRRPPGTTSRVAI